jgi:hypothetical protein
VSRAYFPGYGFLELEQGAKAFIFPVQLGFALELDPQLGVLAPQLFVLTKQVRSWDDCVACFFSELPAGTGQAEQGEEVAGDCELELRGRAGGELQHDDRKNNDRGKRDVMPASHGWNGVWASAPVIEALRRTAMKPALRGFAVKMSKRLFTVSSARQPQAGGTMVQRTRINLFQNW